MFENSLFGVVHIFNKGRTVLGAQHDGPAHDFVVGADETCCTYLDMYVCDGIIIQSSEKDGEEEDVFVSLLLRVAACTRKATTKMNANEVLLLSPKEERKKEYLSVCL